MVFMFELEFEVIAESFFRDGVFFKTTAIQEVGEVLEVGFEGDLGVMG